MLLHFYNRISGQVLWCCGHAFWQANRMIACSSTPYQLYLPFQQPPFHSTFPQHHQQPPPYLTTGNQGLSEKVESEESKVAVLDVKHKLLWDSLVQLDPDPSMVQYHKSFKKGFLDFHQKHNSVKVTARYNSALNSWARNQIANIKKFKGEKIIRSHFRNIMKIGTLVTWIR